MTDINLNRTTSTTINNNHAQINTIDPEDILLGHVANGSSINTIGPSRPISQMTSISDIVHGNNIFDGIPDTTGFPENDRIVALDFLKKTGLDADQVLKLADSVLHGQKLLDFQFKFLDRKTQQKQIGTLVSLMNLKKENIALRKLLNKVKSSNSPNKEKLIKLVELKIKFNTTRAKSELLGLKYHYESEMAALGAASGSFSHYEEYTQVSKALNESYKDIYNVGEEVKKSNSKELSDELNEIEKSNGHTVRNPIQETLDRFRNSN